MWNDYLRPLQTAAGQRGAPSASRCLLEVVNQPLKNSSAADLLKRFREPQQGQRISKMSPTNARPITWGRPGWPSTCERRESPNLYSIQRNVWGRSTDLTNLTNNHKTNKSWNVTFLPRRWLKGLWRVLREAYVGANTSERDILRKTTELQLQLISHLPLKKRTRERGRGDLRPLLVLRSSWGDCYPSLVSTLRHQSLPFRGGETGWGHAPRG